MEDVIIAKSSSWDKGDYLCEITKVLDENLKVKRNEYSESYIMDERKRDNDVIPREHSYPIRYPGATRGWIDTDENFIIKKIGFFDDIENIYCDNISEIMKQFIGKKFTIEKGE